MIRLFLVLLTELIAISLGGYFAFKYESIAWGVAMFAVYNLAFLPVIFIKRE